MTTLSEIQNFIRKNACVNPKNPNEIKMVCGTCGKHFWVQLGTVAWNEKQGRATECSACNSRMVVAMRKESDPFGLVPRKGGVNSASKFNRNCYE